VSQEGTVKLLKVFLAEFNDVLRPEPYTRDYFDTLFFGVGRPRRTPEGKPLAGSVREYFVDLSEERIDIEGEVADWVRIERDVTKVPHWKWWEFREIRPGADGEMRLSAEFQAIDVIQRYHRAQWTSEGGWAVAQISLGGAYQKTWTGEWCIRAPDAASTLHALVGLGEKCSPGARARLTITASSGERQWIPMRNLDLALYAAEDAQRSNLPVVIEAALPKTLRGQDVTVRLDASTASDKPTVLAIPCLRVCGQRPADD